MNLDWQKINWFSKLIAFGLFVFALGLAFVFGASYQETKQLVVESVKPITSLGLSNATNFTSTAVVPPPVSEWMTYTNNKYDFLFQYPPLGIDPKVTEVYGDGKDQPLLHVGITYKSSMNSIPYETYGIFVWPNFERLTLEQWFSKNVDPKGTLISHGTFALEKSSNGGQMYRLQDLPLPDDYDLGPVADAYIMPITKDYVIATSLSQDHELDHWYTTIEDQKRDFVTPILDSFSLPFAWKSYSSASNGFKLKYPAMYFTRPTEKADCFSTVDGDSDAPFLCIWVYDNTRPLSQWLEDNEGMELSQDKFLVRNIGGKVIQTYEIEDSEGIPLRSIYFIYGQRVFKIIENLPYSEEMLNSLVFL